MNSPTLPWIQITVNLSSMINYKNILTKLFSQFWMDF